MSYKKNSANNGRKKFSKHFNKMKSKELLSIESVQKKCEGLEQKNSSDFKTFKDLPLSEETQKGLEAFEYVKPTKIQRDSLPYSLTGYDIVGAAKTGSGKTLALVIPLLECLWKARWLRSYGLGALVISPTRELALQTFTCLNDVGKYHNFSCALLIGGTDVAYERNRLGTVNIIVCTPGRLLQHMDENENLIADQVQMLIIDEADRLLDMGFRKQLNAIITNLPDERQTLLFSATQTKNIKDLSRVCTKDPIFISVHENSISATPDQLQQAYLVCDEEEKLNILWSFIQMHKKKKTIIFVASCRQARFFTDAFCHLRPGLSVIGLWGGMNQTKRVEFFQKFEHAKNAVLIATDIASRGLDFSDVDWVIQMDAPACVDDYIHRVGRTARMRRKGNAVMFLTPIQEEPMINMLQTRNIDIKQLVVDPAAMSNIKIKMQSILAQFTELNQFAQKALLSYVRSVYLMKEKALFNVKKINIEALSTSYGLSSVPKLRFLSRKGISVKTTSDGQAEVSNDYNVKVKDEEHDDNSQSDDENGLLTLKKSDVFNVQSNLESDGYSVNESIRKKPVVVTKIKAAKKILHKDISHSRKTVFNDEGGVIEYNNLKQVEPAEGLDIAEAKLQLQKVDKECKQLLKQKKQLVSEKKKKRKTTENDDLDLTQYDSVNPDSTDFDWLPDPDEVKKRNIDDLEITDYNEIQKPRNKKKKQEDLRNTEETTLAMLMPFQDIN